MVQIPKLREWREARALTQVELAERAGISSRSVAGYEAGTGARLPTVRKLAAALDVEPTDLYGEVDSPLAQAPPETQDYGAYLEELGFPNEQIESWQAQERSDNEAIARELENMSAKDFLERLMSISPALRRYHRDNPPQKDAPPRSESA